MRIPLRPRTPRAGLRLAAALTVLAMLGTARPARADQSGQQPQEVSGRRTLMFWIGTWDFAGQGYAAGTRTAAPSVGPRHKAVRRRPAAARAPKAQIRREHRSTPRPAPEPKSADTHR